jgi:hypothetical protein
MRRPYPEDSGGGGTVRRVLSHALVLLHALQELQEGRALVPVGHLAEVAAARGFVVFEVGALAGARKGPTALAASFQLA